MTKKNELIWGLHIIIPQGIEVILKAKLKFFTVINWRFFQFYIFIEQKMVDFFISNAFLTMIDCSNMFGNCLNQLSIPQKYGFGHLKCQKSFRESWDMKFFKDKEIHKFFISSNEQKSIKISLSLRTILAITFKWIKLHQNQNYFLTA